MFLDTATGQALHSAVETWMKSNQRTLGELFDSVDKEGDGHLEENEFFDDLLGKTLSIHIPTFKHKGIFFVFSPDGRPLSRERFVQVLMQQYDWASQIVVGLSYHFKEKYHFWESIQLCQPVLLLVLQLGHNIADDAVVESVVLCAMLMFFVQHTINR